MQRGREHGEDGALLLGRSGERTHGAAAPHDDDVGADGGAPTNWAGVSLRRGRRIKRRGDGEGVR